MAYPTTLTNPPPANALSSPSHVDVHNALENKLGIDTGTLVMGSTQQIVWGGDTNLYRSAASTLKTDDAFVSANAIAAGGATAIGAADFITQASATDRIRFVPTAGTQFLQTDDLLHIGPVGNTNLRLSISTTGVLTFGDGVSATADTNLYRSAANTLKTDDSLRVAGTLNVSQATGTAAVATDGATGDKVILFGSATPANNYGFGVQNFTLAAFVPTSSVFAVRTTSGAGELSSGTDAVSLSATGNIIATGNITQSGAGKHLELLENGTTDAVAGGVNTARIYVKDNGAGKTQLVVRFNTGAVQLIAAEP